MTSDPTRDLAARMIGRRVADLFAREPVNNKLVNNKVSFLCGRTIENCSARSGAPGDNSCASPLGKVRNSGCPGRAAGQESTASTAKAKIVGGRARDRGPIRNMARDRGRTGHLEAVAALSRGSINPLLRHNFKSDSMALNRRPSRHQGLRVFCATPFGNRSNRAVRRPVLRCALEPVV